MDISIAYNGSEKSLIEACLRKERWAQRILYESYYSPMYAICLRYAYNGQQAEDILHDGFLKVFKNLKQYQPGTSLKSWIKRIIINSAIDQYRKNVRNNTENIDQVYNLSTEEVSPTSKLIEKEILACVQALSPTYRAVFNLYVMEGYSHKEVAKVLDISESTSRANLVKARSKLREMLSLKGISYE